MGDKRGGWVYKGRWGCGYGGGCFVYVRGRLVFVLLSLLSQMVGLTFGGR